MDLPSYKMVDLSSSQTVTSPEGNMIKLTKADIIGLVDDFEKKPRVVNALVRIFSKQLIDCLVVSNIFYFP